MYKNGLLLEKHLYEKQHQENIQNDYMEYL
jgi:hypothetical protein